MQEETQHQKSMYNVFRGIIYFFLVMDIIIFTPIHCGKIMDFFIQAVKPLSIFSSVTNIKLTELLMVGVTCVGTTAVKKLEFDARRMVAYPLAAGSAIFITSFMLADAWWQTTFFGFPVSRILYVLTSAAGIMLIHWALDNISKFIATKLGKDTFNIENESFQQEEKLIKTEYSINIPMLYYYKKRMRRGWINIVNPFRATLVLGTPGSGKSFGVIDPYIRQMAAKGFCLMVYDYKFPTLAKQTFYAYNKNKIQGHLPEGCGFHVVNFTDIEHSHRINPIQAKYIPDLAAATETAATLLESLNKGGGESKGGSEAFFKNSSENFLASVIFFFVNFRKCGYLKGKRLTECVDLNGQRLYIRITGWTNYEAYRTRQYDDDDLILDFINSTGENVSKKYVTYNEILREEQAKAKKENRKPEKAGPFHYTDETGKEVILYQSYFVDDQDNIVEPDTYTGMYSDMAHVLAFLSLSYDDAFDILMQDDQIKSLMAPFKSAYENQAMDQLEGMVGTLRVNAARLVTYQSFWVFSGDDFDLKISDPKHPSYLIIANDPEYEKITGSLNALVLNRLVTRVNSKNNLPCAIIVDELPTLYFYGIDTLIATARSNKVAVCLGIQEVPQLEASYGKVGQEKVLSTVGNIISGSARRKETLEWLSNDIFGKNVQLSKSMSINDNKTSYSINEKMDNMLPASKIADMRTGWLAGQTASDFNPIQEGKIDVEKDPEFVTTKFYCKTNFNMAKIKEEQSHYVDIPKFYQFKSEIHKQLLIKENFNRIFDEVDQIVVDLLGDDRESAQDGQQPEEQSA